MIFEKMFKFQSISIHLILIYNTVNRGDASKYSK